MSNKSKLTEEDLLLLTGLRTMLGHLVSINGDKGIIRDIAHKHYPDADDDEDEESEQTKERIQLDELMGHLQEAQQALAYLIPRESKA